jgi:FKBP-type peptidyl-prolyl cis-trans isomerase
MNRSQLIPAGLLLLGLCATVSAQDPQAKTSGQPDTPAAAAPAAAVAAPAATVFTEQQLIETYGWLIGKELGLTELGFNKDQVDLLVKGLVAASAGKPALCEPEKIVPQIKAFMQGKQEAYLSKLREQNLSDTKAFFEKLKENKNVVELPSGLRYEIVQPGKGAFPSATDTVKVNYTGKLINNSVFDSSAQHGQPAEFQLNQVIPGWTEGIQKINAGGSIRLYIPPQLAYGDTGHPGIPPGSTLIFDVELLEVKPAAPAEVAPAAPVTPKE